MKDLGGGLKRPGTTYEWVADPHQVLDLPLDLRIQVPELQEGGDLMVTDRSSRFTLEDQHITHPLNHAEVLWNRAVQRGVSTILRTVKALGAP